MDALRSADLGGDPNRFARRMKNSWPSCTPACVPPLMTTSRAVRTARGRWCPARRRCAAPSPAADRQRDGGAHRRPRFRAARARRRRLRAGRPRGAMTPDHDDRRQDEATRRLRISDLLRIWLALALSARRSACARRPGTRSARIPRRASRNTEAPRLRCFTFDERLREVEIDGVAVGELGILLQQRP